MRLNQAALLTILAVLPVSVDAPDDSTSTNGETRVTMAGSVGRYALIDRGCEGQVLDAHPHDYSEGGLEAIHTLDNGLSVALRGGAVHEKIEDHLKIYAAPPTYSDTVITIRSEYDNTYVNPSLAYEGEMGGIGVGVLFARQPLTWGNEASETKTWPTFHVRGGRLNGRYIRVSFLENVPLYTGGGYFDVRLGAKISRRWDMYAGVNTGPFDGLGLGAGAEYRALPNLAVSARSRLGAGGGENQSGIALGLSWISRPPVAPRYPATSGEYHSRMWKPEADTLQK